MISARVALSAFVVLAAMPAAAQAPVSIQFQNGNVTIRAANAPLRTILAEWARVGGSEIVNHERVAGTVDALTLENVSERYALSVLLRNLDDARTETFTLVLHEDADDLHGRISVVSDLGTALLGARVGDVVEWCYRGWARRLRIERRVSSARAISVSSSCMGAYIHPKG